MPSCRASWHVYSWSWVWTLCVQSCWSDSRCCSTLTVSWNWSGWRYRYSLVGAPSQRGQSGWHYCCLHLASHSAWFMGHPLKVGCQWSYSPICQILYSWLMSWLSHYLPVPQLRQPWSQPWYHEIHSWLARSSIDLSPCFHQWSWSSCRFPLLLTCWCCLPLSKWCQLRRHLAILVTCL